MKLKKLNLIIKIKKPSKQTECIRENGGKNISYKFIDINWWYDSATDITRVEGSFEFILFGIRWIDIEWSKIKG